MRGKRYLFWALLAVSGMIGAAIGGAHRAVYIWYLAALVLAWLILFIGDMRKRDRRNKEKEDD